MTRNRLFTLYVFFAAMFVSCSKKDAKQEEPVVNENVKAVQEYLATNDDLKIFSTSFAKIKLSDADASQGLTVFAPSDDAIATYDPNARVAVTELSEAEIKDHVVKGVVKKDDLTNGKLLSTLSGKELKVSVEGNEIRVNGALIEDTSAAVFTIDHVLSAKPGIAEITVYDGTQWSPADTLGKPVAGAEVSIYYTRTDFKNDQPAFTGQTDANGKISFAGLPEGIYFLAAKKDDKRSYFEPADQGGQTVAYMATGIYQSWEEIIGATCLPGTAPGDFKLADLNGDGKLDANDKGLVPVEIAISSNKTAKINSLIGYTFNHMAAVFQSKTEVEGVLDSAYSHVGTWQILQVVIDGILSDDADCTGLQNYCALDNFTFAPSNSVINSFWQTGFSNISSLNRIITNLPALNLPAEDAGLLMAQARALRGYTYLQLATYFGELPLQQSILPTADMSRASLTATYDFIKNDLSAAIDKLPNRWGNGGVRRISAHACKLLLARAAAAQDDFAKVKQLTAELKSYQLVDESDIFTSFNNAELIWDINSYIPREYKIFFTDTPSFIPTIRYAEVLLLSAEATIRTGGTDLTDLNLVYSRRGRQSVAFTNAEQALGDVRAAWQFEYYREGQRFSKLVKWGLAPSVLNGQGYKAFNNVLPIPQVVLRDYYNMTQNMGY